MSFPHTLRHWLSARHGVDEREDAPPASGPLFDRVRATSLSLRRLLDENIMPFWSAAIVDEIHGGYHLNHDVRGRFLGPAAKHLVTQARTLWYFARLVRFGYDHRWLDAARAGLTFLRDRMWDDARGGFHWAVDCPGREVINREQRVYGQAFALFALSEYARVSGCVESLGLAHATFDVITSRFHDPVHGGFVALDAQTTAEPEDVASAKWQNDHVHVLEALVSYHALNASPPVRERILECMTILTTTVMRSHHASSRDRHSRSWRADARDHRVSYGHDVECAWLLLDAADALDLSPSLMLPHARAIFGTLQREGLDRRRGGVHREGLAGGRRVDRQKIWWVQAEVLVGCLDLYVRTGKPEAGRTYLEILRWIESAQADWDNGEWHECVTPGGRPEGRKAGPWKGPYHAGRAMMECLMRVSRLSPGAASG